MTTTHAPFSVETKAAEQTMALGAMLASLVRAGDVVLLVGELGSGKTTFVRGLVGALDPHLSVTSPTFVLCHRYETTPPIAHVDCWRMNDVAEVVDLALDEVLDEGGVALIEWGELAEPVIGRDALVVTFALSEDAAADERRSVHFLGAPDWSSRLDLLARACGDIGLGGSS